MTNILHSIESCWAGIASEILSQQLKS